MKKHLISLAIATLSAVAITSCRTDSKSTESSSNTTQTEEKPAVEVIYSSKKSASAPAYDPQQKYDYPLSLIETTNPNVTPVSIDDVGAYKVGDITEYRITLLNMTKDTVEIASVELPDDYFDACWDGMHRMIPGLYTGLKMRCDSAITVNDYRLIINYKNNRYPAQVFHVNLHPDVLKLKEEKAARR